jgi:CBS domain-containing protein
MSQKPVMDFVGDQQPVTVPADATVARAARVMQENRIGAVLVTESARLVGIFTERDALFRVIAEGRDPGTTLVSEVMTRDPLVIAPGKPFVHALHMMYEGGFRHVPVVDNGRLLGMVSARDALGPDLKEFMADLDSRNHIGEILG